MYQSETCEDLQQWPRPLYFLSLRNEVSQEVRSHRFDEPEGPKQLLSPLSSISLISKGSEKVELFLDVGHMVMGLIATRCQEMIATGFSTLKSGRSFIHRTPPWGSCVELERLGDSSESPSAERSGDSIRAVLNAPRFGHVLGMVGWRS